MAQRIGWKNTGYDAAYAPRSQKQQTWTAPLLSKRTNQLTVEQERSETHRHYSRTQNPAELAVHVEADRIFHWAQFWLNNMHDD